MPTHAQGSKEGNLISLSSYFTFLSPKGSCFTGSGPILSLYVGKGILRMWGSEGGLGHSGSWAPFFLSLLIGHHVVSCLLSRVFLSLGCLPIDPHAMSSRDHMLKPLKLCAQTAFLFLSFSFQLLWDSNRKLIILVKETAQ